jgi:predicted nucleic acid-binding Zn ribbon protein
MPTVAPSTTVEVVHDVSDGVVVECIEVGGRLRIRVVSSGYHSDWQVQFPKGIRERGTRYVVTGVREAGRGGFYRTYGEIRRLL